MAKSTGKSLALWIGILLGMAVAQPKYSTELFPKPEVIRDNVEFWKKIYTVYPTTAALIHDLNDMSLIY